MRICIVGLGWLGEPLGKFLQEKGFQVFGSTTSPEKALRLVKEGLEAFHLLLNPRAKRAGPHVFFDTDILIINIPPSSKTHPESFYLKQIETIRAFAEKAQVRKIIYISTTSVYPSLNQVAQESDDLALDHTGNVRLLEAENMLWKDRSYKLTVIRFGGLFGAGRIPGKYFSCRDHVAGHPPVNYIYRDDAIRLVHWVILHGLWDQTYNGVAPLHPSRRMVYEHNSGNLLFDPPKGYENPEISPWKIVSSEKIQQTGFEFIFEDPQEFPYGLK